MQVVVGKQGFVGADVRFGTTIACFAHDGSVGAGVVQQVVGCKYGFVVQFQCVTATKFAYACYVFILFAAGGFA